MHRSRYLRLACLVVTVLFAAGGGCDTAGAGTPDELAPDLDVRDADPDTAALDERCVGDFGQVPDASGDSAGGDPDSGPSAESLDPVESACTADDHPGPHEPAYDSECMGNVGCTHRTCAPCTSSCVLCDGPRCVGVVADDSCLHGPASLTEWVGEPAGAVPATFPPATFALDTSPAGTAVLSLTVADEVPSVAKWADSSGAVQSRLLAPPVVPIADRVLVAGTWSMTNYCTGTEAGDSVAPMLLDVVVAPDGSRSADLPFTGEYPWFALAAWIRVFEDASGLRVFQWFEPATSVTIGYGTSDHVAAFVTEPIPADAAVPLASTWGGFDWVTPLRVAR